MSLCLFCCGYRNYVFLLRSCWPFLTPPVMAKMFPNRFGHSQLSMLMRDLVADTTWLLSRLFVRVRWAAGRCSNLFGRTPSVQHVRFLRTAGRCFNLFRNTPSLQYVRFLRAAGRCFNLFGHTPSVQYVRFLRASGRCFNLAGHTPSAQHARFLRKPKPSPQRRHGAQGRFY